MEARSQFAVKLLPSLADFAFLMPIAFLFGRMDGVRTLLSDCDTGWHIRTGEWIIANGWVPMRDIFSFSKPGSPWFAWEWLSDVLFARLNGMGGLQAEAPPCVLSQNNAWRSKNCELIHDCAPAMQQTFRTSAGYSMFSQLSGARFAR